MTELLANTKTHTVYLRRHVKVVEMWECEWKEVRNESDVKTFLAPPPRQKWKMTQKQIIAAVVDGALFGMIECDIRVPPERQDHFAEMQPIATTLAHICVSTLKSTTSRRNRVECSSGVTMVRRFCFPHHCYDGTSRTASLWITYTKSLSTKRNLVSNALASRSTCGRRRSR